MDFPGGKSIERYSLESPPLVSPVRHCLWFLAPLIPSAERAGLSVLDWQLPLIEQALPAFKGMRICTIVEPSPEDDKSQFRPVQEVAHYFEKMGFQIEVLPNRKTLREGPALVHMLGKCPRGPEDVIFFGQSKCVSRSPDFKAVRWWTEAMIETVMANAKQADGQLSKFGCTGAFKKYGEFNYAGNHRWHYSGSFYWLRATEVFKRDWEFLHNSFCSVEAWPGYQFPKEQAGCLFLDKAGHMYDEHYWQTDVFPALDKWREGQPVSACEPRWV